jgi:retron-type reverse transcriptase
LCKTIRNEFDKNLTFEKLEEAHIRASKGKRNKEEVIKFEMDLESNLVGIYKDLKNGTYKFGKYREFYVYEPKERLIKSLPYRDRIVHQWYVEEFIKPYFYPRFIKDTYACLDNRGTHMAVLTLQNYMRKMQKEYGSYYVLKCDIKKFFYNINKEVLINILKKRIKDKKIINLTYNILNDGSSVGIPIGNYTSQYFANIYLNEIDHFAKDILHIKYYVRYMDDFIFLLKDKSEAKRVLASINDFVGNYLKLELNKKTKYFPVNNGIDFCGFVIYETHILLRKRFKKKLKNQIMVWKYLKMNNKLDKKKMERVLASTFGHASHADSFNFILDTLDYLIELY